MRDATVEETALPCAIERLATAKQSPNGRSQLALPSASASLALPARGAVEPRQAGLLDARATSNRLALANPYPDRWVVPLVTMGRSHVSLMTSSLLGGG